MTVICTTEAHDLTKPATQGSLMSLTLNDIEGAMSQISARLPSDLIKALDKTAARLKRSRADVIRQAIEYYIEDAEDLSRAIDALRDPADAVLDWDAVKRELLHQD